MADALPDAIVSCCAANWLPAAAVALHSCRQQGLSANVELAILCAGATDGDQGALEAFNRHNGTTIRLLRAAAEPASNADAGRWGVGAVLNLTLDRYLSSSYRRVLYLDADVLAHTSVVPLLDVNLHGGLMGAVDELWQLRRGGAASLAELGLGPTAPYFNSGVMLFDWQKTLASEVLPRALRLLGTRKWTFIDQDVLNVAAQGQWLPLDLRWNVTTRFREIGPIEPWIRHFTMRAKPWASDCRFADRKYKTVYSEALAESPWQDFVQPGSQDWSISIPLRLIQRRMALRRHWQLARYRRRHSNAPASEAQ